MGRETPYFPPLLFFGSCSIFCVVKTENQSFSAPKQQGTRLLRRLVVPIIHHAWNHGSLQEPWSLMSLESECTLKDDLDWVQYILFYYYYFLFWVTVDLEHAWGAIAEAARNEGGSLSEEKTLPAPISPGPLICMRVALRKERRPLAVTTTRESWTSCKCKAME